MNRNTSPQQQQGCLWMLVQGLWNGLLGMFGLGRKAIRNTLEPLDTTYREYVDTWVSERLAFWLHETRSTIDVEQATKVLLGEAERYPNTAELIRKTLLDAKVTFSQREGKQYMEIEAYMTPQQSNNGHLPQVLRWRAEREIPWAEIPNDVRERLIRARQPVTLGYAIPE